MMTMMIMMMMMIMMIMMTMMIMVIMMIMMMMIMSMEEGQGPRSRVVPVWLYDQPPPYIVGNCNAAADNDVRDICR